MDPKYTTQAEARTESGILDNTYITDTYVTNEVIRAEAIIDSMLSGRYKIPLDSNATRANSPGKNLLNRIATVLSAAYVLQTAYGTESLDTDKDGYRKEKYAMDMLNQLVDGTMKLLGSDGKVLDPVSAGDSGKNNISGYPRNSDGRKFTTNDRR